MYEYSRECKTKAARRLQGSSEGENPSNGLNLFPCTNLRIAKSIVILLLLILTQDFFLNTNLDQHSQRNCSCSVHEIESYKINNKFFDDYVIKNDHGFMDAV